MSSLDRREARAEREVGKRRSVRTAKEPLRVQVPKLPNPMTFIHGKQ